MSGVLTILALYVAGVAMIAVGVFLLFGTGVTLIVIGVTWLIAAIQLSRGIARAATD